MKVIIKKNKNIKEDVGTPMATLTNTVGIGNPVPGSTTSLGSGDRWDNIIANKKTKTK